MPVMSVFEKLTFVNLFLVILFPGLSGLNLVGRYSRSRTASEYLSISRNSSSVEIVLNSPLRLKNDFSIFSISAYGIKANVKLRGQGG